MRQITKARRPVQRSLNWIPAHDGIGDHVRLHVGKDSCCYLVQEIQCDFHGERAFQLDKLDIADPAVYYVRIAGQRRECECLGHLRHGRCKHADAVAALLGMGKLPQKFPTCSRAA